MSSGSLTPICFECARLRGVEPDVGWTCEAFGRRPIPTDILASVHDHREPFDGDGGLTFKSKEGEDMAPSMAPGPRLTLDRSFFCPLVQFHEGIWAACCTALSCVLFSPRSSDQPAALTRPISRRSMWVVA